VDVGGGIVSSDTYRKRRFDRWAFLLAEALHWLLESHFYKARQVVQYKAGKKLWLWFQLCAVLDAS
jgi:hypothetical protein